VLTEVKELLLSRCPDEAQKQSNLLLAIMLRLGMSFLRFLMVCREERSPLRE